MCETEYDLISGIEFFIVNTLTIPTFFSYSYWKGTRISNLEAIDRKKTAFQQFLKKWVTKIRG